MTAELTTEEQSNIRVAYVLKIMKEHFGEEVYQVLMEANRKRLCAIWRKKAEEAGDNSIETLLKTWEPLRVQGWEYAMDETETGFQMNCIKCPTYDFAKHHGITEQMFYMVCENDLFVAEGFNTNIGFRRTKTLMQGHDCCNHFYYYKDKNN